MASPPPLKRSRRAETLEPEPSHGDSLETVYQPRLDHDNDYTSDSQTTLIWGHDEADAAAKAQEADATVATESKEADATVATESKAAFH